MADNTPTSANDMLNGAQAQAKTPEEVAKENDLLPRLITHLDRHLIFPLLQFVAEQQEEENSQEMTKAKYELLNKTNMTDYVASLYCELKDIEEAPPEFATKRQEVLDRLELLGQESEKITDLLSREDVVTSLRSDKVANLEFLKKEHNVSAFKSRIGGGFTDVNRLPSKWSTSSTISATSNIAAVTTKPPATCSTNSAFSQPTTTKCPPQHGESLPAKS
jgi:hypothetical protein